MNDGLRILIDRMMEFPQDFELDAGKAHGYGSLAWERLLDAAKSMANRANVFTEEEKAALAEAENEMMRRLFTAKVMEALVPAPPQKETFQDPEFPRKKVIVSRAALQMGTSGLSNDELERVKTRLQR